jgi:putative spermidine/putrescine transport system permease protein
LLLVAPALTMVLALFVYPLALSLVSAFTVGDGQPGLGNFVKALELYGVDMSSPLSLSASRLPSSECWQR